MSKDTYYDFLQESSIENEPIEMPADVNLANVTFRVGADCRVFCDGDFLLSVKANQFTNENVASGQHLLQFFSSEYDDLDPVEHIVEYEAGKKYFENVLEIKQLVEDRKAAMEAKARAEEEAREKRRKEGENVIDFHYIADHLKRLGVGDIKYTGRIKYDVPDGKGKAIWADGSTYEGEWVMGKPKGHGKMIWSDGAKYEGKWFDGKRNGYGKMVWPNNRVYEGGWSLNRFGGNNEETSHGKYTTNDLVLEGDWDYTWEGDPFDEDRDKSMLVGHIEVEGDLYYLN